MLAFTSNKNKLSYEIICFCLITNIFTPLKNETNPFQETHNSLGLKNVCLELDLASFRHRISLETLASHSHVALINAIQCLLDKDWNVKLRNIFREPNRCG